MEFNKIKTKYWNGFLFIIGTGFYIGKSKLFPGTLGSILAIPLVYYFGGKTFSVFLISILIFIVGILSSNYIIKLRSEKDPKEVVIDEIFGYFVSYLFIQPTLKTIVIGFLIFRFLDILKPFPIKLAEKLPKGYGVMTDDLLAGLMTLTIMKFIT